MGKHRKKKKKTTKTTAPKKVLAPPPRAAALKLKLQPRQATLFRGQCNDLFSMVLVRWRYSQLLHFSRLILALLNYTDGEPHQFREQQCGAAAVELEQGVDCSVTLTRFYTDVLRFAEAETCDGEARDYYRALLRGCFLVALVCDIRVRRFCFTRHTVLARRALHCTPVPTWKLAGFMAEARALTASLLEKQLSLRLLSDYAVQCWREDYLLRGDAVQEEEEEEEKEILPPSYHQLAIDEEGRRDDVEVAIGAGAGIDGYEDVVYGAV